MPTTATVTLDPEVTRLTPALVDIRRAIHQAPELGFERYLGNGAA